MRRFTWIEWNLGKIDAHALSSDEGDEIPDVFGELSEPAIFVIMAY